MYKHYRIGSRNHQKLKLIALLIYMKLLICLPCILLVSCRTPFDLKTERGSGGMMVASSKQKEFLIAYSDNDPKTHDSTIDIMANQSPILTYHGLGAAESSLRYSQFYSKENGFIYDRDLDGFPDEALMHNGKRCKLEVWVVDRKGKLIKKLK